MTEEPHDARPGAAERPRLWHLLVEHRKNSAQAYWHTDVLGEFRGGRDEALHRLEVAARAFRPIHPWDPQRTTLYRTSDGFMTLTRGISGAVFRCRFLIAELLWDSGEPKARPPGVPSNPPPVPPTSPPRPPAPPPGRPTGP